MKLFLSNTSQQALDTAPFEALLEQAKDVIAWPSQEMLELHFCEDDEIQDLNKNYRQKDKVTDVLSFNLEDPTLLGQIVISVPQAARQAEQIGQSLDEELKFLFVHGFLHLLGYDHETPDEEAEMLEKAYKILGRQ